MAELLTSVLPSTPGLLPKWLLFVATVSIANTIQAFTTTTYTRRIYTRAPADVTPLSARTFGLWTLFSGAIRAYGAFHITDEHVYRAVALTYAVAWLHFVSELLVFRTAGLDGQVKSPLVVASASLVWMWWVAGDYVVGS